MSDTTEQECACCGFDTDCIQGLCSSCYDYNCEIEKLNKQLIKSIRNKPVAEHPDVQRLIGQVAELQIKSHELQDENERVKHLTEARFNDWLIAKGQIRELQAENERLKKAIKHLSLGEYTDALSEGCDANGAFDCLCEAVRNWKDEVLKGNQ